MELRYDVGRDDLLAFQSWVVTRSELGRGIVQRSRLGAVVAVAVLVAVLITALGNLRDGVITAAISSAVTWFLYPPFHRWFARRQVAAVKPELLGAAGPHRLVLADDLTEAGPAGSMTVPLSAIKALTIDADRAMIVLDSTGFVVPRVGQPDAVAHLIAELSTRTGVAVAGAGR